MNVKALIKPVAVLAAVFVLLLAPVSYTHL